MIVLCDIDGTAANINHRRHLVEGKKQGKKVDWPQFFKQMANDTPNTWCQKLLSALTVDGHEVIFVSGRPQDYEQETIKWLFDHYADVMTTQYPYLFMRRSGDYRPDYEIKQEIYDIYLKHRKDEILFVIDDRQQVVDMWRSNGLVVLQCDEGAF